MPIFTANVFGTKSENIITYNYMILLLKNIYNYLIMSTL